MYQKLTEMLFRLCRAAGTPGDEEAVRAAAEREFAPYAETGTDALGNLTAKMGNPGAKEHILVDAHLDQIGLIVTQVDENGFLRVDRCGGVERRVLPGSPVTVLGRETLRGIVCCTPPHLAGEVKEKVPPVE